MRLRKAPSGAGINQDGPAQQGPAGVPAIPPRWFHIRSSEEPSSSWSGDSGLQLPPKIGVTFAAEIAIELDDGRPTIRKLDHIGAAALAQSDSTAVVENQTLGMPHLYAESI